MEIIEKIYAAVFLIICVPLTLGGIWGWIRSVNGKDPF